MRRATIEVPSGENITAAHAVRDDGTASKIRHANYSDGTGLAGEAAGKSTIKDLLLLHKVVVSAYNDQARTSSTMTPRSPFGQLRTIFEPQIAVGRAGMEQQAYCLGPTKHNCPAI